MLQEPQSCICAGVSGVHKLQARMRLHGGRRAALERPWPGSGRERREVRQETGEGNMMGWGWGWGEERDLLVFPLHDEQCEDFPPCPWEAFSKISFPLMHCVSGSLAGGTR